MKPALIMDPHDNVIVSSDTTSSGAKDDVVLCENTDPPRAPLCIQAAHALGALTQVAHGLGRPRLVVVIPGAQRLEVWA